MTVQRKKLHSAIGLISLLASAIAQAGDLSGHVLGAGQPIAGSTVTVLVAGAGAGIAHAPWAAPENLRRLPPRAIGAGKVYLPTGCCDRP
jgi:hypothetical protein